ARQRGMVEDRVEVTAQATNRIKAPSPARGRLVVDAYFYLRMIFSENRSPLIGIMRYRPIFALRASDITCSNSFIVSTPGTRYLPTMKDGVPRHSKASA